MKIKSILAMIKNKKRIFVTNINETQWIGDGESLYPLFGMPVMTQKQIFQLLDIPQDKQQNYLYVEKSDFNPVVFEDSSKLDKTSEQSTFMIMRKGRVLLPIISDAAEIDFIDMKALTPFEDEEDVFVEKRGHCINIKRGMLLIGIIHPVSIIDKEFMNEFKLMYELMKKKQKEE